MYIITYHPTRFACTKLHLSRAMLRLQTLVDTQPSQPCSCVRCFYSTLITIEVVVLPWDLRITTPCTFHVNILSQTVTHTHRHTNTKCTDVYSTRTLSRAKLVRLASCDTLWSSQRS